MIIAISFSVKPFTKYSMLISFLFAFFYLFFLIPESPGYANSISWKTACARLSFHFNTKVWQKSYFMYKSSRPGLNDFSLWVGNRYGAEIEGVEEFFDKSVQFLFCFHNLFFSGFQEYRSEIFCPKSSDGAVKREDTEIKKKACFSSCIFVYLRGKNLLSFFFSSVPSVTSVAKPKEEHRRFLFVFLSAPSWIFVAKVDKMHYLYHNESMKETTTIDSPLVIPAPLSLFLNIGGNGCE